MSSRVRRSWLVSGARAGSSAGTLAQPVEDLLGDGRVQRGLAGGDAPYGLDEVVAAHLLEDVARGAGHDRGEQRLVVVVGRQDERRDLGVAGPDLPADVDARPVGQAAVEDGHVGSQRGDPPGRLLGETGLADDLDVAFALEELLETSAHDLVVVEEEHPDAGIVRWGRVAFAHVVTLAASGTGSETPSSPGDGTLVPVRALSAAARTRSRRCRPEPGSRRRRCRRGSRPAPAGCAGRSE